MSRFSRLVLPVLSVLGLLAVLVGSAIFVTPAYAATGPVCYVKADAAGVNTGNSWKDAYTDLQSALGDANCTEIWVAEGVYKPTSITTARTATFQLKSGVALYGGFLGYESALNERKLIVNATILSGDIDNNDSQTPIITDINTVTGNTTNSYHVVIGATGATIDGFTITAGAANKAASPLIDNYGGGMNNYSSSPIITNVTFSGNLALIGGGMSNSYSNPTVTNVTFSSNWADDTPYLVPLGGGMYNSYSSPTITNVTFSNNLSNHGGGMYNSFSSPIITNVTFSGNSAGSGGGMENDNSSSPIITNGTFSGNYASEGGGMYNSYSSPTVSNVTFSGNSASNGGGMSNYYGSPIITNVTFSGNSADSSGGGGMYSSSSGPTLKNVILANSTSGGDCVLFSSTLNAASVNNLIEDASNACGLTNGANGNIIGSDPLLGALGDYGGPSTGSGQAAQTLPLLPGSPAINAGNATYCTAGSDQRGMGYVGICDIGAFESQGFTIYISSGNSQSTFRNETFANPLTVRVIPSNTFEPVNGGVIIFSAPTSGPSADLSTSSAAISSIISSITATANGEAGNYQVQASARGANSVNFSLTNILNTIAYAKSGGLSGGACATWATACELRYALTNAVSGQEIWAVAGVYKPTSTTTDRTATFQLKSGVALYGGFAGTETLRTQRDPAVNVTILSGDIDSNDSQTPIITDIATVTGNTSNSYNVVAGATGATIDGFTITAGFANGGMSICPQCGGGMYNNLSSPTVTNVIFAGNFASHAGGGMGNYQSNPIVTNCAFIDNSGQLAGGMYNEFSSPTVTDVTFSGNWAVNGGGMSNYDNSSPALTNVTFGGNSATSGYGGGMYNESSSPTITNTTFSGNKALYGGGMDNESSSPMLTNVTFSGNSITSGYGYGGGMLNVNSSSPTLKNVILANSTSGGDCVLSSSTLNAASANNLIEDASNACGLTNGANGNIIGSDPLLGALGDYGGPSTGSGQAAQTLPLLPGSPAINCRECHLLHGWQRPARKELC